MLTDDKAQRKAMPIARGVLDYFPLALAEVARVSGVGNEQHNPGQPMHWSKDLSTDHADCILRHMIDRGTVDTDGLLHSAKVAWRALAMLQIELEEQRRQDYPDVLNEVEHPRVCQWMFHKCPSPLDCAKHEQCLVAQTCDNHVDSPH
jgi:hypothetical protein